MKSCVCQESKTLFRCESYPRRVEVVVAQGDVMGVPAGVGHRLLVDIAGEFEMLGSYPNGKQ